MLIYSDDSRYIFVLTPGKQGLPALLQFLEKICDVGIYDSKFEIFSSCLKNWEHRFSKCFMHRNFCYLLNDILGIWNFNKEF